MSYGNKKSLTQTYNKDEYLTRIENLLPECRKGNKLIVSNDTLEDAAVLCEDIIISLHSAFDEFPETDFVCSALDAIRNIYTLIKFITISVETILSDEE